MAAFKSLKQQKTLPITSTAVERSASPVSSGGPDRVERYLSTALFGQEPEA